MNHAITRARAVSLRAATALSATALTALAGTYTNDFSAGATGLTIYTISGASPEVRTTDGNPGGYLKLTDAVNSTTSTVIFPDLDNGFPVQAFTFAVDCRIGNGSDVPADGFSINFARTGDATITTGAGFNGGAAEEGTATGLSVGFDIYNNGNGDVIGFSIKLDGQLLIEREASVLNGALDDENSLETGPVGSAGWAPFKVELRTDGTLDVFWKNVKVVDNIATGWQPSGGRFVFGARTGGLNAAHHFDNVSVTTTPAPLASVTSAKVTDAGYRFEISDFGASSVVTTANVGTLTIDGTNVTPTSVTKTGSITTVTYAPTTAVDFRSTHTYSLAFVDQANTSLSGAGSVVSPALPTAALLAAAPELNTWNVREVRDGAIDPFGLGRATAMFLATTAPTDSVADFINFSDPQDAGDRGMFKLDTPFLTNDGGGGDDNIIQGANTKVTITGTTPEQLRRTFWVQSDDGFALRVVGAQFTNKNGAGFIDPAESATLIFPDGTGNSNTRGLVQFPAPGDYTIEFLYFEGGGGAFNEVAWANGDFVNNPDATTWSLVGGGSGTPVLAGPLPATGTAAPVGQWNIREIRDANGGAANLAAAITFASTDPVGGTISDGTAPVLNYNDLDGSRGATGLFNNDLGLIGNLPGEDNDFILVGRTTVPVPAAGDYTLAGTVDDGFAVKIVTAGGRFVSTSGPGGLDPRDSTTYYNPAYSDTPTLAVAHFDAPGNYEILFISQEGGGGSSGELAFAAGRFGSVGATSTWQLLGDASGLPAPTPFLPADLPGPEGGAGVWGIRFIRNPNPGINPPQGDNIYNALASVISDGANGGLNTDGTTPYLNFSDVDGNAGQENMGLFRGNNTDNNGLYGTADDNYLGSTGEDDQMVAIAKARVVIPTDGEWTFGVHSDDGFALRIDGALFTRVSGDNWIDAASKNTVYFRFGTGDSNARAVTTLTAGEHDIEFIWFEGGGGSNFELYAAPGGWNNDGDTPLWRLVGGPNDGLQLVAATTPPADSGFVISTVGYDRATSVVSITFPSEAGVSYSVQWSADLVNWASAGAAVTGAAGSTTTTANAATLNGGTAPTRFFVRVTKQVP